MLECELSFSVQVVNDQLGKYIIKVLIYWIEKMNKLFSDEDLIVKKKDVSCDGGGGSSGHPNIYLNLGDQGQIVCPYCSQRFILDEGILSESS